MTRITLTLLLTVALTKNLPAGDGYEVSSKSGDKVVTYRVNFGGGKRFEQHTGFDPASKKFVYLSWTRGEPSPKPAPQKRMTIFGLFPVMTHVSG